jgi:hypothetical protein
VVKLEPPGYEKQMSGFQKPLVKEISRQILSSENISGRKMVMKDNADSLRVKKTVE